MIGEPLIILPSVDSTNNHAMREYRAGRGQVGTAYFAIYQTQGKGQREKSWQSNEGENIMLSLILESQQVSTLNTFPFSCAIALACTDFFSIYAGAETKIKWPNDLFWRDRKAGGILIETAVSGHTIQAFIVGIGININQAQFPGLSNKVVSLKQITGKSFDPIDLTKQMCICIEKRMDELQAGEKEKQLQEYNARLWGKNTEHLFKKNEESFHAMVTGVTEYGELVLQNDTEKKYRVGEIEWVL